MSEQMTEIKLKNPCPFCGKHLKIIGSKVWPDCGKPIIEYEPECENANCVVNYLECYYGTPEEAAEAWDRRASPWRTEDLQKGDIAIVEFSDDLIAKVRFNGDGWEIIGLPVEIRDGAFEVIRWMEVPE